MERANRLAIGLFVSLFGVSNEELNSEAIESKRTRMATQMEVLFCLPPTPGVAY